MRPNTRPSSSTSYHSFASITCLTTFSVLLSVIVPMRALQAFSPILCAAATRCASRLWPSLKEKVSSRIVETGVKAIRNTHSNANKHLRRFCYLENYPLMQCVSACILVGACGFPPPDSNEAKAGRLGGGVELGRGSSFELGREVALGWAGRRRARQRLGQYRGMPFTTQWAQTVLCMRA